MNRHIEYAIGGGGLTIPASSLSEAINMASTDKDKWRIYERHVGEWEEVQ